MRKTFGGLGLLAVLVFSGCAAESETGAHEAQVPGEVPPPDTYVYKKVGYCEIKADVYRLAGESPQPVILYIHGGALIMGARTGLDRGEATRDQLGRFLEAGFTVVSIDYRLAPETKLPAIIEDLKDAYSWIRRTGPVELAIDPDRIAILGKSAGGYLTLMSGFCLEPRPRALVSFYGYGDITGDWYSRPDPFYRETEPLVTEEEALKSVGTTALSEAPWPTDRGRFYLYCRQNGLWPKEVAGFDPFIEDERFGPFSPERNVTADYPPTLFLHGDQDTDVPYELSAQMAALLSQNGVSNKLITLEGRGHSFDFEFFREPDVSAALDEVVTFLVEHTN